MFLILWNVVLIVYITQKLDIFLTKLCNLLCLNCIPFFRIIRFPKVVSCILKAISYIQRNNIILYIPQLLVHRSPPLGDMKKKKKCNNCPPKNYTINVPIVHKKWLKHIKYAKNNTRKLHDTHVWNKVRKYIKYEPKYALLIPCVPPRNRITTCSPLACSSPSPWAPTS